MSFKLTVITDAEGHLIGASQGHHVSEPHSSAGLVAGPGQTLHEVIVPVHLQSVTDPDEFHKLIVEHLPR
jgi:hypothetical protein